MKLKTVARIIWQIFLGLIVWTNGEVDALQCHRCIYTRPHDEVAMEVLNYIQTLADPMGYQVPEWKEECHKSPSDDDLSLFASGKTSKHPSTSEGPIFEKSLLIMSSLVLRRKCSVTCPENDAIVTLPLPLQGGQVKSSQSEEGDEEIGSMNLNENALGPTNATQIPVCFQLNVRAKTEDPDVTIMYIFRDGAMANYVNYMNVMNRCYSGIDAVAAFVGEQYVRPIREYVMDVEACVCNNVDGCNNKNFDVGGAGGSTPPFLRALRFLTILAPFVVILVMV